MAARAAVGTFLASSAVRNWPNMRIAPGGTAVGTVALAPRAIALVTTASVSRSITGAMWRANRSGEMSTISGTVRPYAQRQAGQPPAGRRRPDRRRPWWLSARSAGPAPPTAALASRKPGQTSAVAAPAALTSPLPGTSGTPTVGEPIDHVAPRR